MHVIHIIESFAAGSLMALATLCTHVQDGVHHTILHAVRPETPADFQALFPHSTAFYYVPMQRSVQPWHDVQAYRAILRLLRRLQPDLVHCHSSKAGVLGRLAALQRGIPCAYTPHGYAFLRTDISPCARAVYKGVEYLMAQLGQYTIACGEQEFTMAQQFCHNKQNAYLVENCIDVSALPYSDVSPAPANALLRVGSLGRLAPQRDPALFGKLAENLRHEAQWVWIGAAREDSAELPPHVQRTGWVEHAAALACLDALDVYVQTSRWEGLSYSILEAMSRGKPVVATDIPANRAVIQHGSTGFLASTAAELTDCVRILLQDATLRRRMGEAARAYVLAHHSAASVYRVYTDIYTAICASGAR